MDSMRMRLWGRCAAIGRTVTLGWVLLVLAGTSWAQQETGSKAPPSGGACSNAPRSRLTLSGLYRMDTYSQKNFFLGAGGDTLSSGARSGFASDKDAFWIQELTLEPRVILSDNLNVNLALTLAQGIWGLDNETPDREEPGYTNLFNKKDTNFLLHVDWAYAAYHNEWSRTRWYFGRQKFGLGNLLALDEDAGGLQVYRDLPGLHSSLGLGYAKQFEGTNGLTDENFSVSDTTSKRPRGPDGRDADLYYAEWILRSDGGGVTLNPFFASYSDKAAVTDSSLSYLPEQQGYLDARFRPNISSATVMGVSARLRRGAAHADVEIDILKGKDKIGNVNSGPSQMLDRNNGKLKGRNILVQAGLQWTRLEIDGTLGMGSGDPDPRRDEGNINFLRNQGHFSLLEVWGNGIALDERAPVPQGMGNPFVRAYRGLENTKIYQGGIGYRPWPSLRIYANYSLLRTAQAVAAWQDLDHNGVITLERGNREYGYDPFRPENSGFAASTDIGKEIDLKVDWTIEKLLTVSLHGGSFTPGPAAGYIVNGTAHYLKKVSQIRLSVVVPIREFSLGG